MIRVRHATADDAEPLAASLRAEDRAECEATFGPDRLLWGLRESLALERTLLAEEPAGIVCVWGCASRALLCGIGQPWCLTTDLVPRHRTTFLRGSLAWKARMLRDFAVLENHVDARHVACHRWLTWLGFELSGPAPFGAMGLPFRRFRAER